MMTPVRRAVIDVGTNSIKLLVAEVRQREVQPLLEQSKQTRLGQGFYANHILQPGAIAQSAQAVAEFAAKAKEMGATVIRVVATSAAREAHNQHDLTSAIESASGLSVRVISGEQEALYGFQGVTSAPGLAREHLLLLDVGGGSAQFILGQGVEKHFAHSFDIGTVRLLEQSHLKDPPEPAQLQECRRKLLGILETEVGPKVLPALRQEAGRRPPEAAVQFVAVGGTASILACMESKLTTFDRERLEAVRLTREQLSWHVDHLWRLPMAERKLVVGLPPNRADVILTGVAIYEAMMNFFHFEQLRVSTRGLRFALVLEEDRS